jgi:epsilon-lactone hydrolase
MPSRQMTEFLARCPVMPGRMPTEDMAGARQAGIARSIERNPILPNVRMEKVTYDQVEAVWYRPQSSDADRAILYIHGGAFMWSSAEGHCGVISRVAAQSKCDTLALDYKVAPFNRFPSQIEEGVRLYRSLLQSGYAPGKVALVGDSCGGGLVLSVIYALRRDGIPLPACASISSAYIDLTNHGESIDWVTADPCVSREGLDICLEQYLEGHDPADPLASPLFADLAGFPPTLVQVGSRERLLSDSTRFAAKADATGVDVKLEVYDGCVHLWHWWVPEAPEAKAAIESIGEFVLTHTRKPIVST